MKAATLVARTAPGFAQHTMLCYAMLCYAMLCHAMLCYAMPCHAMPRYAMLCHAMLCYAMLCYAMLCYAMLCHAVQLPTCIISEMGRQSTESFSLGSACLADSCHCSGAPMRSAEMSRCAVRYSASAIACTSAAAAFRWVATEFWVVLCLIATDLRFAQLQTK